MAILPTKDSLSGPRGLSTQAPIATINNSGLTQGLQQLGQGIANLGSDIQQQQDTVDLAKAQAALSQGLIDTKDNFRQDGDYTTFGQRARQQTSDVLSNAASNIRNPAMREKFKYAVTPQVASTTDAIDDAGFKLNQADQKNQIDDSLEAQRRIYVDPNSTDAERDQARSFMIATIGASKGTGIFTPDEAEARTKGYVQNADTSRLKLLADTNPGEVAGWNPSKQTNTSQMFASLEAKNGLPSGYLAKTMQIESGGKDTGPNSAGAAGYFQFIPSTANQMGVDPHNLPSSADGAARLASQNAQYLRTALGHDPSAGELYLAHQQGAAGAAKLLANPDASAASIVGTKAVIQNGGKEDMTAGQFAQMWVNKFNGTGGMNTAGPQQQTSYADAQSKLPDWVARISPEDRQVAYQLADTKLKQLQVQNRGNIEQVVQDAPSAIANTGAYSGSIPSQQQFIDAYGDNGAQKYKEFTASMDVAQTSYNFRTQSVQDIENTVAAAQPHNSGDGAALDEQRYDMLSKAATQVLAARKNDPATYTMSAFPSVQQAWNDAQTSGNYQPAMNAMAAAQQSLGMRDLELLPKQVAAQAVSTFKDPNSSDTQRLGSIGSLIFATQDKGQQQAVFNQLVDAGLPALTQGAIEASARGDSGAAQRLMQAALVDPAKLPNSKENKPADIDAAIYSNVWEPGAVGDAAFGVGYGDTSSLERAQNGHDLLRKAVSLRLSQGQDINSAVAGASKDLFGDVQVYNGSGSVSANFNVPTGTDTATLTSGLIASRTAFHAALDAQREAILGAAKANASDGTKAILENTTANRMDDILNNGVFVQSGNGIGLRDPYTGQFVVGQNGQPLSIPIDKILKMGADLGPQGFADQVSNNADIVGSSGYDQTTSRKPLEITVTPKAKN